MSFKPAKVQFNGGELSPWLEGRVDIAKYDKTAKLCRNFIPLAEGCLKRRGGTHFWLPALEEEALCFKINVVPLEAKVLINGQEISEVSVARGETVDYEVSYDGYASQYGQCFVLENTTLDIELISGFENRTLTINTAPQGATVIIDGYQRHTAKFNKGHEASYMVFLDGYETVTGNVVVDDNKEINVTLVPSAHPAYSYGDWGNLVGFVGCSACGDDTRQLKCFLIKFENGYLPIIFNARDMAPAVIDEGMFVPSNFAGYNSAVYKKSNSHFELAVLTPRNDAIIYKNNEGQIIFALDFFTCAVIGWQLDEYGNYATFYNDYVGVADNGKLSVYYKGNVVWELKGRNNG